MLICSVVIVLLVAETLADQTSTLESAPVLGVTSTQVPTLRVISARDPAFDGITVKSADGDAYDAAGLVQDVGSAYYVDDLPDTHTFGTGEESAGVNALSQVDTRIAGQDFGPGLPGTNLIQVNYFTSDGSDIVPAGMVSPDSLIFDSWRLDVGTSAAGTNKIDWTGGTGFTVVDSGICLGDGGQLLGCFELAVQDSDATGLSGIGLLGLGGEDIAGYGVDEMILYWEIQVTSVPACGDGNVDAGEDCDDGNNISGDGCSSTCRDEVSSPAADLDRDGDVDLDDYATFQRAFTGL